MDLETLRKLYTDRGRPDDEADRAVAAAADYITYLARRGRTLVNAQERDIRAYLDRCTSSGGCVHDDLLALARASALAGNNEMLIYFSRILERSSIIENIRSHMTAVLGPERTERLFGGLEAPPEGAPPEDAVPFTRRLVEELQLEANDGEAAEALRGNAHGIPAESFADERARFLESSSLEEYLAGYHERSVATLAEHARSGTLWFEQEINYDVVAFVRENDEILGGVLDRDRILWTKIPYDTSGWIAESDPDRRRYLACHCPMAREALKAPGGRFPRVWCNCTAGFVRQRFNAVFGEETDVELLETVLDGDDRCRFAVHVPPGVRERFAAVRSE